MVWHFQTHKFINKIESKKRRTWQFLYNDFRISYSQLLDKAKKNTVVVRRLFNLCVKLYKKINNLNPIFMTEVFKLLVTNKSVRKQYALNLNVTNPNEARYSDKSLWVLGPKIRNNLPSQLMSALKLLSSKNLGMVSILSVTYRTTYKKYPGWPYYTYLHEMTT